MLLDLLHRPAGLRPFYQPIFDIRAEHPQLHAVECLTRGPQGTTIESAPILFEYVRQLGAEARVDRLCVARALEAIGRTRGVVDGSTSVCLNVHGVTLAQDQDFVPFVAELACRQGFAPWQLTIEILEFRNFAGDARMAAAIDTLHEKGMRIAIDDLGQAESNLRMLLECHADYFKLDHYFVRGIESDPFRRSIVAALVDLAPRFGAWIVAEGVETPDELATVRRLGVCYAQGYLFAPPRSLEAAS
jgi:EAL domain-containing protein (putative c-di-GMP-specific phosphodiesterase class I)